MTEDKRIQIVRCTYQGNLVQLPNVNPLSQYGMHFKLETLYIAVILVNASCEHFLLSF